MLKSNDWNELMLPWFESRNDSYRIVKDIKRQEGKIKKLGLFSEHCIRKMVCAQEKFMIL